MTNTDPSTRTVVTAGDAKYAWGVFLLLASMRRWKMQERILVGAYNWPQNWHDFIADFPNVEIVDLDPSDRRCVAMTKPNLMLMAKTDYVTWIDSDGFFFQNCSSRIYGAEDELYARSYRPEEIDTHSYARQPQTISTWIHDVNDLPSRKDVPDICTNVVGISLKTNRRLLEKWRSQMLKVLPPDVGIVSHKSSPYFQTDESVLNSLLSCWGPAPKITEQYILDHRDEPHYIHFSYNPKPWQEMWTCRALLFYDEVMALLDWCRQEAILPEFTQIPKTFIKSRRHFYQTIAPLAPNWCRFKKIMKKLGIYC